MQRGFTIKPFYSNEYEGTEHPEPVLSVLVIHTVSVPEDSPAPHAMAELDKWLGSLGKPMAECERYAEEIKSKAQEVTA